MSGTVIQVPQADGEIVVTYPGRRRVPLAVTDGRVTVHDDDLTAAVLALGEGYVRLDEPAVDYDPAEHTVDEVNKHLDKHPEQAAAVLAAERGDQGRGRKGLLEGPHAEALTVVDDEAGNPPADAE